MSSILVQKPRFWALLQHILEAHSLFLNNLFHSSEPDMSSRCDSAQSQHKETQGEVAKIKNKSSVNSNKIQTSTQAISHGEFTETDGVQTMPATRTTYTVFFSRRLPHSLDNSYKRQWNVEWSQQFTRLDVKIRWLWLLARYIFLRIWEYT